MENLPSLVDVVEEVVVEAVAEVEVVDGEVRDEGMTEFNDMKRY